jgi:hypothetical protein
MSRRDISDASTPPKSDNGHVEPPLTPPLPHSYESFSDLAVTSPSTPSRRRALFSSTTSSVHPEHHRLSSGSHDAAKIPKAQGGGHRLWNYLKGNESPEDNDAEEDETSTQIGSKADLSTLNMICLTIGLAGAQLTWTVEMA